MQNQPALSARNVRRGYGPVIAAAQDLGGRPLRTFLEIVLPMVSTGIISSALFAFVISLNEFVMALFLTDRDTQTLPPRRCRC